MVMTCIVKGCKVRFVKGGCITFHSFPKDENKRQMWETAIGHHNVCKSARICSKHFKVECFIQKKNGASIIKDKSIPTELLSPENSVVNISTYNTGPSKTLIVNDDNGLAKFNNKTDYPLEMINNKDTRPSVDLRKDAARFQWKFSPSTDLKNDATKFQRTFNEGIERCLRFLDDKISTFMCDRDSFRTSGEIIHKNVPDFLTKKDEIYTGIKSLISAEERKWCTLIGQMRKSLLEKVALMLAETQSDVTVPPSDTLTPCGRPADYRDVENPDWVPSLNMGYEKSPLIDCFCESSPEDATCLNTEDETAKWKKRMLLKRQMIPNCSEAVSYQDKLKTIMGSSFLDSERLLAQKNLRIYSRTNKENSSMNLILESKKLLLKGTLTFKTLVKNLDLILKPNLLWGISPHSNVVICARWNKNYICEKKIVIDNSLVVRVVLKGLETNLSELMTITSISDISDLLEKVERYKIS